MNERSLTVAELIHYRLGDELVRRLHAGDLFTVDDMEMMRDIGFHEGRASESVVEDLIDLLDGEVWAQAVGEEVRNWMKDDLASLLYGDGEDDMDDWKMKKNFSTEFTRIKIN